MKGNQILWLALLAVGFWLLTRSSSSYREITTPGGGLYRQGVDPRTGIIWN